MIKDQRLNHRLSPLIPVLQNSKKPVHLSWQDKVFAPEDFNQDHNVGLRLDNYIDIDIDNTVIHKYSAIFKNSSKVIFGRKSNPGSHLLFKRYANGNPEATKYCIPKEFKSLVADAAHGLTLFEIRTSNGQQTVIPNSKINNEDVVFEKYSEPDVYPGDFVADIKILHFRSLIDIIFPAKGQRDDFVLAVSCVLYKHGLWSPDKIDQVLKPVLENKFAANEALPLKGQHVADQYKSNGKIKGIPTLQEILGVSANAIAKIFASVDVKINENSLFQPFEETEGQKTFFKNIIFLKKDHVYYDRSTRKEYRDKTINVIYGKFFKKSSPLKAFQIADQHLEVEHAVYYPSKYNSENPVIDLNNLQYLNIYSPDGPDPREATTISEIDTLKLFHQLIDKFYPEQEHKEYILNWYSTILQRPGIKLRHSPINWSPAQQIGKSKLFEIIRKCIGQNATVIRPENAVSREKEFLYDKQLVLVDELKFKGDYETRTSLVNHMKPLITDDLHDIRPLYKPNRQIHSFCSFAFNTNYKDAITLTKDDQRYSVFKIDHNRESMGGSKFFTPLVEAIGIGTEVGPLIPLVKHFLLNRQITNFNPGGTCLKTKWLLEMSEATSHPIYTDISIMIKEASQPFDRDIIGIYECYEYLKNKKTKFTLNSFAEALEQLGATKITDCVHKKSKRQITLYIIRNKSFYNSCKKSEITNDYWLPLLFREDRNDSTLDRPEFNMDEQEVNRIKDNIQNVKNFMNTHEDTVGENDLTPSETIGDIK